MSHAVLHRWKVRRGKEDDFAAAWARLTDLMIEQGGAYGARLHKGEDGSFIAYSWWPSKRHWDMAQLQRSPARALLAAAVEERLPDVHMALIDERYPAEEESVEYETPAEEAGAGAVWEEVAEEAVAAEELREAPGPEPDDDPGRAPLEDFEADDPNAPLPR
jgi:heme-degrading monooxygenase HmoA